MSTLDRRHFLGLTGGALCVSLGARSPLRAWFAAAAPAARLRDRVLVVVELRGGNDGLNTLVPVEDDRYHRARPTLAIQKGRALALDELNGLHPSLERLRRRHDSGSVALVQGVGYAEPNLSHFLSQDVWASAVVDGRRPETGWLGRFGDLQVQGSRREPSPLAMVAVGSDVLPYALRGAEHLAPAVADLATFAFDPGEERARLETLQALNSAPTEDPEVGFLQESFALTRRASEELAKAGRFRSGGGYAGGIGGRLRAVAQILGQGLPARVFHVVQNGYDTHTEEQRSHAQLLDQLDRSLDAFLEDMAGLGRLDDTLVLTVSEFGRRVEESGTGADAGTDHGAASVLALAGGRVRGGIHGEQPDLEYLDRHGNVAHRIDFRQVYATVLEDWLGADAPAILGEPFEKLPLLR